MKFKNTGVFTPKGVQVETISTARTVTVTEDKRLPVREKADAITSRAVSTGSIDRYALRNHWTVACGHTTTVETPWDSITELKQTIRAQTDAGKLSEIDSKPGEHRLTANIPETTTERTVRNQIQQEYGQTILCSIGYGIVQITLSHWWPAEYNFSKHADNQIDIETVCDKTDIQLPD